MIGVLPMLLVAALGVGQAATPLATFDLEATDGGFVDTYAGGDVPQWSWGAVGNGPGAGYDGLNAWSTGLTGDYRNDTTNCLRLVVPDLSAAVRPVVVWQQWYAIAPGDSAAVLADDGTGWRMVDPIYGYPAAEGWSGANGGWAAAAVDLSALGASPQVCLRFAADADGVVDDGWFVDNLAFWDGDVVPPRIDTVDAPPDTEDLTGPYAVRVVAQDDVAVSAATLSWSAGAGTTTTPMTLGDDGAWQAAVPGQAADTRVTWHVDVTDGANATRHPAVGEAGFRVFLPAPTGLDGPDGRVVGDTVALTWEPPDSVHTIVTYEVLNDDVVVASATTPGADVPLAGGVESFVVRARYDVGVGDVSAPIEVDGLLPTVTGLAPAEGYTGEHLRLDLQGSYLMLVEGDVEATLGEGVTLLGVDVRNVDQAVLDVEIAATATPGPRALTVTTPAGDLEVPGAFTVLDAAQGPRLVDVSPASFRQGERGQATITYVGELAGDPVLDVGEGIVVESVTDAGGGTLLADIAVATNAPLGDHPLTVDDGVRFYSGASLTVDDVLLDVGGGGVCGCATRAPASVGWGALVLAGALARGRRGRRPGG